MRVCKSRRRGLTLIRLVYSFALSGLMLFIFQPVTVLANNEYATIIKQAEVVLQGDDYVLNAEIDYRLSPAAKEALLKGIALYWTIPVILQQHRDYLWDKELRRVNLHYQVQYFALLNVYRVKLDHSGQINNFVSFAAAFNAISRINALKLLNKSQLAPKQSYQVKLQVVFDREALPIPLRPIAYVDSQWYLSSNWLVRSFSP